MVPLQIEQVAEPEATSHEGFLEKAEGVLLLTSFALATGLWCCLLALGCWKALLWILDQAV